MKIEYVEISGFRGFKELVRFDFPASFVVISGRNGSGKSSVLDAVDFALTGTINKYAVSTGKKQNLLDHIWWVGDGDAIDNYVEIGFLDKSGEEFSIRRSRTGSDTDVNSLADRFCSGDDLPSSWPLTLMQTTLIRDETISSLSLDQTGEARFTTVRKAIGDLSGPDYTERTGSLLTAATFLKDKQESRIAEVAQKLGRALEERTKASSLASQQSDVAEAKETISKFAPDLVEVSTSLVESVRRRVAEQKQDLENLAHIVYDVDELIEKSGTKSAEIYSVNVEEFRQVHKTKLAAMSDAEKHLALARHLQQVEIEKDELASKLVTLLESGSDIGLKNGHCPLCDAERTEKEFESAIAIKKKKLRDEGVTEKSTASAVKEALVAFDAASEEVEKAEKNLRDQIVQQQTFSSKINTILKKLRDLDIDAEPSNPEILRQILNDRQSETSKLELALFVVEASSAHDRTIELSRQVDRLRKLQEQELSNLSKVERVVESIRQIDSAAKSIPNQILTEQFDTVLPLLKELYIRLRPHADWREIEVDFGGRVRSTLNFSVANGYDPQFMFSSGQRRVAGVAFLLAIHLSRPWSRWNSLLLDDPVQHIDDYRALNLVEVLSAIRRNDRQIIVAVEDEALADVLCRRLRSTSHHIGRRFDLATSIAGSAMINRQTDIFPLQKEILKVA